MKELLRKYKVLAILLVLILLVLVWVLLRPEREVITPTSPPSAPPVNTWSGIMPGASLFEDVTKQLGEPVSSDGNKYEYRSQNPNINHEVLFEDNIVVSIKRITVTEEQVSAKNMFSQHGRNYLILYSERSNFGDNLYVYLDKGIAFIGNPIDDSVLEIWYFKPVSSVDEFISEYAPDFSLTFDPEKHGSF